MHSLRAKISNELQASVAHAACRCKGRSRSDRKIDLASAPVTASGPQSGARLPVGVGQRWPPAAAGAQMRAGRRATGTKIRSLSGSGSERVLVNMDTEVHPGLINSRFAYVSVSRASHDAQIFTNDATTLAQNLSRDASKASAIDFRKNQNQITPSIWGHSGTATKPSAAGLGLSI